MQFTSDPDATLTPDGRLVVFARGADNAIWHQWQVSRNGNWSGWGKLGNNNDSLGGPSGTVNAPGGLVVFIRGTDNAIWHRWQEHNNGDWSGWESLGGSFTSDPDATLTPDGRLVVFARGADNAIWHQWQVSRNGNWSGWGKLGNNNDSLGGPSGTVNAPGGLVVFIRGTDNAIWHRWQEHNNGDWSGWESLGGSFTSDPDATLTPDGRLVVFARGADNAIWHQWQVSRNGNWSGWGKLGNNNDSLGGPSGTVNAPDGLVVFIRGTDNAIWHRWQEHNNGDWSGWESLGSPNRRPRIDFITPFAGLVNSQVHIIGNNFDWLANVKFGLLNANFQVISPTEIIATVPTGAVTGNIVVSNPDGTTVSASNFNIVLPPQINGFTPKGSVNANVQIDGNNFTFVSLVLFGNVVADFNVVSPTRINATVPQGAHTNPMHITTPGGIADSLTSFVVDPTPPPVISSFTPVHGRVNTPVTIIGIELSMAKRIQFGVIDAVIKNNTSTSVSTIVPENAITGKISVTTAIGGGSVSSGTFTIDPTPPQITHFSPYSGTINSTVEITGIGFTSSSFVTFGGIRATIQTRSFTRITATVPPNAHTGSISVTTNAGLANSQYPFTVTGTSYLGLGRESPSGGIYSGTTSGLVIPPAGAQITTITNNSGHDYSLAHGAAGSPFIVIKAGETVASFVTQSPSGNWTAQVGGLSSSWPDSLSAIVIWQVP